MRTFIFRSIIFFVFAGAVTVAVFFFINRNLASTTALPSSEAIKESLQNTATQTKSEAEAAVTAIAQKVPEEGVPLSSLPLNDSHKKALAAVNIDVETFMLTPAMVECGGEKLGAPRIEAIIGGAAPSILEISKLIPCLTR